MKFISDIIKGVLIGVANIIPGVSGGTMMVSMGVYEKILGAINTLFKNFKKSLLILIPLAIGMILGIGGFSYIIPYCLEEFPLPTCLCFIGLILGGIPAIVIPAKKSLETEGKKISYPHIIAFIAFFALAILMAVLNETESSSASFNLNFIFIVELFVIGIIASATMVIPGVSGSLVLMLLGFYSGIVGTVRDLIEGLRAMDMSIILHAVGVLIPFGLGVVFGIFAVAKLIEWLFKKFPSITYSAILGLIFASPIGILVKMAHNNINPLTIIIGIVLLVAGTIFTYSFGKQEYK